MAGGMPACTAVRSPEPSLILFIAVGFFAGPIGWAGLIMRVASDKVDPASALVEFPSRASVRPCLLPGVQEGRLEALFLKTSQVRS